MKDTGNVADQVGHLFVVQGDLNQIACDAVMIPTDASWTIEAAWSPTEQAAPPPGDWAGRRVVQAESPDGPAVWYADIGGTSQTPLEHFVRAIKAFVTEATAALDTSRPEPRTVPWRLALPLVGGGKGGAALDRGGLVDKIVRALADLAGEHEVDIVLVLFGNAAFGAAQRARRQLVAERGTDRLWHFRRTDPSGLHEVAELLARHARAHHLVLFLGAGVSAGAGVPTWKDLLSEVGDTLQVGEQIERIMQYDLRDAASLLEALGPDSGDRQALRTTVANVIQRTTRYSLAHGLLASLPSCEAVTTNFDTLFESAARTADRRLAVLPAHPQTSGGRWVLKLHGSVEHPARMVLTRPDYLEMPRQYGALMGLVQAMLLMRHMLFVGYSLSDEDLHELLYEVRMARRGEDGDEAADEPFGTVLTLFDNPLSDTLWRGQLRICSLVDEESGDVPVAARELEKFLDLVVFLSSTAAPYLLDPTFDNLLTDDEHEVKRGLAALADTVRHSSPTSDRIVDFLREFGWQGNAD